MYIKIQFLLKIQFLFKKWLYIYNIYMLFTLVNKNYLIPEIHKEENLNLLLQKLFEYTYNKDKSFSSNIYIVGEHQIYFCNNNEIYCSEYNVITKLNYNLPSIKTLESIKLFCSNQNYQVFENKKDVLNMDVEIKIKDNPNIIIAEEVHKTTETKVINEMKKPKVKSKEELELIKLIEETMSIYQNEVNKIKEIERQIKIIDDNTNSLLKKKREKVLTNFSKLKNDYQTYTLIKQKKELKPQTLIPNLFELKYNYFEELIKDNETKNLLDKIKELNLDEILNQKCEINNNIVLLSNSYDEESKKLNVKFDHSWEDLEIETEPSEINNSKFGTS